MVEVTSCFCGEDNIFPVLFQGVTQDLFAVSVSIDVSRIEEVASKLKGSLNRSERDFVVCGSVAVPVIVSSYCPGSKPHLADFESCFSQRPVFHNGTLSKLNAIKGKRGSGDMLRFRFSICSSETFGFEGGGF